MPLFFMSALILPDIVVIDLAPFMVMVFFKDRVAF